MDSQTNALYDNQTLPKHGLCELSFNSVNAQKNSKSPRLGNVPSTSTSQANSPCGRKFVVMPAGTLDPKKALESSTSPFLSPSASFVKSKQHHSMKSLKLGKFLCFQIPRILQFNPLFR